MQTNCRFLKNYLCKNIFAGTVGIVDYTNHDDMKYAVSLCAKLIANFCKIAHSKRFLPCS